MLPTELRRVFGLNFARSPAFTSILFLLPLHFVRIGYNGWQIGVIVSLISLAPLLSAFPAGWVNDRISIAGAVRAANRLLLLDAAYGAVIFKRLEY